MTDEQIIEMARKSWFAIISQPTSPTTVERYPAPHDEQSIITFARLIAQRQIEIDAGICDKEYEAGDCDAAIREQK